MSSNDPANAPTGQWKADGDAIPCGGSLSARDLLFGRLAVHNGFVDDKTVETAGKQIDSSRTLAEVLVSSGAISDETRRAIEHLLNQHIATHGDDPQQSLLSLASPTVSFADPPGADTVTFARAPIGSKPVFKAFGDYQIVEAIAEGGMGVVYKAHQTKLNRLVALKMIKSGELADEEQVERFYSEAKAAGKLDHPGIVPVYEVGQQDGRHFFSMAFVEGASLHERVKNDGPLPAKRAAGILKMVAQAVQFGHNKGIVHRDIKPQNILLDETGSPRVTDFGLAKCGDSEMTVAGQVMGTPSYMPPEQAEGKQDEIGPVSDVYSLGATLYFTLTGRPPFQTASPTETLRQVINNDPVPPRRLNSDIPRDLETVCLKCLRKERAGRYHSAEELAEDLARWLESKPIVARRVTAIEKSWLWCQRKPLVAGLLLALVLVAVVGSLIVKQREHRLEGEALVKQLLTSETTDVPKLVRQLEPYRDVTDRLLRDAYALDSDESSKRRLNIALALLPVDTKQVSYLKGRLLTADPSDVDVIRRELVDDNQGIRDDLWKIVEQPADESQLLRAASALALYAPRSERWKKAAGRISAALVNENPLRLLVWIEMLHPIRSQLTGALGTVFRNRDGGLSETQVNLATNILERYAADDVEMLTELVLDSGPNQFVALFDKLNLHQQDAGKKLNRELDRKAMSSWDDPPLDVHWTKADSTIVKQIETAHGVFAGRFAFCQTMPLKQFVKVAESLRKSGYRPIRFRPFAHNNTVQVAAVWTRDGREWQMAHDLNAETIRKRDAELRGTGFMPLDVAGYVGEAHGKPVERYSGVWIRKADNEDARMYAGASSTEHMARFGAIEKGGFPFQQTLHAFRGLKDEPKYSGVLANMGNSSGGTFNKTPTDYENRVYFDRVRWDIDISKSGKTDPVDRRYAAVWQNNADYVSQESHGLAPKEHLTRCRELISKRYRPVAMSAVSIGARHDHVTASIWHRPLIPEDEKERLAKRQANAVVALLRMGDAEHLWPLLKHSPDPRLRTLIIHRLNPLGASPADIVKRLNVEPDVSIRRALILILGEYKDASQLDRKGLSATLLKLYRNNPDPGIHGAAEWVLRQWGHAEDIAKVDREFATGKAAGERHWYATKEGHTMVLFQGPVEILLGSPGTEKDRISAEYLHRRRIVRSFGIASKEVTVKQFEEFLRNTSSVQLPYSKKYASEENCPQIAVTWYQAAAYCRWLSEQAGIPDEQMCYPPIAEIKAGMKLPDDYLSRTGYRLPTEAEWEFACRSNTNTSYHYGQTEEFLAQYDWLRKTSEGRTWPVGKLKPNESGLFDMQGNVTEWCQERWLNPGALRGSVSEDREDNVSLRNTARRLLRGGSFFDSPSYGRSAFRYFSWPDSRTGNVGFRPARTYQ